MPLIGMRPRIAASLLAALLAALLATICSVAAAAPDADRPMLQIEAGMHSAPIQQMRLDTLRNRLVSVSTDRTARVWQLPQLKLVQTLRMPAAPGFEGELHAIAISADGRWLALGGTTGFRWRQNGCVHVYALDTLRLARSVCGWPDIVQTLAFAPDGRWLAVGLGGRNGLRVVRTSDWTEQPTLRDPEYGGVVRYLEFSAAGLLASSAGDGYLRLYDRELKLVGRRKLGESTQLGGVRFAPDGVRMAVGTADRPQVFIVDTTTLATVVTRTVDDARQRDLCCIGYSVDGRHLFVNGTHDGGGATPLYRIAGAGTGRIEVLPVGEQTFTNMAPLPDGSLAFATDVPTLAIIGPDGRLQTSADGRPKVVRPAIGDFRGGEKVFAASNDGTVVRVPMREGGAEPIIFSIAAKDPLLAEPGAALNVALSAALRRPGSATVRGTDDSPAPTLDGKRLALDPNERARAHAFSADGSSLILGTLWSVRRHALDGTLRWRADVNAPANNVLVTRDQRFVIATLSDGTVRWLDHATGAEVAALYLNPNRRDWVLWRPDGYYASSDEGDRYVGWLVSHGAEREPDFFSAVQFERIFYRQELAIAGLRNVPETTLAGAPTIARIAEIAPARVRMTQRSLRPLPDGTVAATIALDAEPLSASMTEAIVYVNGLPVTPFAQRALAGAQRERLQRELSVVLTEPDNTVRVEIPGKATIGIGELWLPGPARRVSVTRPGDLYVVAVGVNRFPTFVAAGYKENALDFAAADASAVGAALERNDGKLYRHVFLDVVADGAPHLPTKAAIRTALDGLRRAGPDDTVIVFLASHGISDRAGNYYLLPRDGRPADADAAKNRGDESGTLPSLLGWQEIFDALRLASGRRVLVVDTCQAGEVTADRLSHTLRKRSAASSFALMLAARGDELSQELRASGHGVFTYGLLQALDGGAPPDAAGRVTLAAAFEHARTIVAQQRPSKNLPQTPQLVAPGRLGEVALADAPRAGR